MTGTSNANPEPQPAPAENTGPTQSRTEARNAAFVASLRWYDAIEADLRKLLDDAGVRGDERVVSMTVGIDDAGAHEPSDECCRETLRTAALVGWDNEVVLTAGTDNPLWADAVDLWIDLIKCLSHLVGEQVPAGLLIDVDSRVLGSWHPYFCPDEGNLPDGLHHIPTVDEVLNQDPFAELLADPNDEEDEALDILMRAMEIHDLEPPATPAHEPGDCEAAPDTE